MIQFPLENSVIFDTETTGVKLTDEIIELGIIDGETGKILMQTLLKPKKFIPMEATDIHGITNEDVADAPTWTEILPDVLRIIHGKRLIAYNSDFDYRMLLQTAVGHESPADIVKYLQALEHHCAMLWYAAFWGEPGFRGGYKWQKLTIAASQQGIDFSDLEAHRAVDDCEITRRLIANVNAQLAA